MDDFAGSRAALRAALAAVLDQDGLLDDEASCAAWSSDVYAQGVPCALVARPATRAAAAEVVRRATALGYALTARGGGLSYTGGFAPVHARSVVVDLTRLDRIIEIAADDMFVTVEAGVTWKQLHAALAPLGLRLPCFGTFSGAGATVGGGLSNGALFLGSARHGTVADALLGLEVVLADGTLLHTGQAAFAGGRPFYRTHGPDLSGLFVHDAGVFGLKLAATFRLMRTPPHERYASFVFSDVAAASCALSELARAGYAEEAYVFDPATTRKNLAGVDPGKALRTLAGVASGPGRLGRRLRETAALIGAGRQFMPEAAWSLHLVCAGRSAAAVDADLDGCRALAAEAGGAEVSNTMPKAVRANLFPPLNDVLGAQGERWAALNAKVAHGDAARLIDAAEALLAAEGERMQAHGITASRLLIAIGNHAFSYEPVLHWRDAWLPVHRARPEPAFLARLVEPPADPAARAVVHEIRSRLVELFAAHGAASNQLGKTYRWLSRLEPATAALLRVHKAAVDPAGLLNPGALEFEGIP